MMKCGRLFLLVTFLMMQNLVSGEEKTDTSNAITVNKKSDNFEFKCKNGNWKVDEDIQTVLKLPYSDDYSKDYECVTKTDNITLLETITIKFRTCDNCIEMDIPSLSAIIVGNILATVLIACAVYNITRQPKGKNFSGNKASDKVSLIHNGERDTYQSLTPGQTSEYSGLMGVRKN